MDKVLIYGGGQTGEQVYQDIKDKCDVIGFLDGNPEKKGQRIGKTRVLGGVEAIDGAGDYDKIIIASFFWKDIKPILLQNGVSEKKIEISVPEDAGSPARDVFLECYAQRYKDDAYAVAEGGVFRGEFAAEINRCFPKSKLYLFDTFEGFDRRDVDVEKRRSFSNSEENMFGNTSVDLVMSKITHKENVEIHKGFFPETAKGVSDIFCFVNLDFDLYQPILGGLRFFWPQMADGAVILVHDYYNYGLPGVKAAIDDFEKESGKELIKLPIGDGQSIAVVKT